MEMKADAGRVLMSDVLRGEIPELDGEAVDAVAGATVIVVVERVIGDQATSMVGVLSGVMLGADPELQFRVDLSEALDVLGATDLSFSGFELHHGERVIRVPGPFIPHATRVDEVNVPDQLCTLGLHLKKLVTPA